MLNVYNIPYLGLFSKIRPVVDKTGATPLVLVLDTLGNDAPFSVVAVRYVSVMRNTVSFTSNDLEILHVFFTIN